MINPINPVSTYLPSSVPQVSTLSTRGTTSATEMSLLIVMMKRIMELMKQMMEMLGGGIQRGKIGSTKGSGYTSGGVNVNITNNVNMLQYGSGGNMVQAVNIGTQIDIEA